MSDPRLCCFLNAGGKNGSISSGILTTRTRTRCGSSPNFDIIGAGKCFADQSSLSRVENKNSESYHIHSLEPRQMFAYQTQESREDSRQNATLPSDVYIPEMEGPSLQSKKIESATHSPRSVGGSPGSSSGFFVPEKTEFVHAQRIGFSAAGDDAHQPMEGWTEEDQRRFLAALRMIGAPTGRRTGLGFREWMAVVSTEVPSRACASS